MIFRVIAKVVYTMLVVVETVIALRFVFKLVAANASNPFVVLVYHVSNIFVAPFQGILNANFYIGRFYIDIDALIAILIYMLVAYVVVEVIKVFSPARRRVNT